MKIIAHRGRLTHGNENRIESLSLLPDRVAGVEVDVRVTSDGVPVLHHDEVLVLGNGNRLIIEETTYQSVKAELANVQRGIATLEGYLRACEKQRIPQVFLDLKPVDENAITIIIQKVRRLPVYQDVVWMTKSERTLALLRQSFPMGKLALLRASTANIDSHIELAQTYGVFILFIYFGDLGYFENRAVVKRIHAAGFLPGASVINTAEAFDAALNDRCAYALTDSLVMYEKFNSAGIDTGG